MMKKYALMGFMAIFMMSHVFASKEGMLLLSNFHLESVGIGSSGKVILDGVQNERNQISHLTIQAFDKTYVVPQKTLDQLSNMPTNGIQISYEQGYRELGGRTVYIQFQKGFTSGVVKKIILEVKESGQISVLE